jgi:hypothetical protein
VAGYPTLSQYQCKERVEYKFKKKSKGVKHFSKSVITIVYDKLLFVDNKQIIPKSPSSFTF